MKKYEIEITLLLSLLVVFIIGGLIVAVVTNINCFNQDLILFIPIMLLIGFVGSCITK